MTEILFTEEDLKLYLYGKQHSDYNFNCSAFRSPLGKTFFRLNVHVISKSEGRENNACLILVSYICLLQGLKP